ncbi:MAG: hypothetical protein BWK79_06855 [Beggiatoa sp. IS2]|nr:MAG: hypothetical protein BWK79_06855 [Beggiatoa sp. IS2]
MKKKSHLLHLLYQKNTLILGIIGLVLIVLSFLFKGHIEKEEFIAQILAETGGLFLVVGVLHWMFDYNMREEMLRDISYNVLSNERIRQCGIIDCYDNSLELKDHLEHWKKAEHLIIGAHYAEGFFSNYVEIFQNRCQHQRQTTVLLSNPEGSGIKYLKEIDPEVPNVAERVQRITKLLTEPPYGCPKNMHIYLHPVVLRYLFVASDQCIWFIPMLNSKGRSPIPTLQIRADSSLYNIFYQDIQRLIEQSELNS